jgi:hypothetical protein
MIGSSVIKYRHAVEKLGEYIGGDTGRAACRFSAFYASFRYPIIFLGVESHIAASQSVPPAIFHSSKYFLPSSGVVVPVTSYVSRLFLIVFDTNGVNCSSQSALDTNIKTLK